MSPVPGGRSTRRKSGSSQKTSVRNCSSALCSIGPRQMTGWSSLAKKPIEMQRTPPAPVGGTSIESITAGGCWTPSMRGMEKPHTSASITATFWPRWARATARLVVTDDLPTPPLPDAMSSTRVCARRVGEGDLAALGVAVGRLAARGGATGRPAASPARAARCSSVITPKERSTDATPMLGERAGDAALDLVAERAPGDGEGDLEGDRVAVDAHVADHVEVDDRAVELGILDGSKGGDDVVDGDGHGVGAPGFGGICTTAIGRIPADVDRPHPDGVLLRRHRDHLGLR